MKNVVIAAIAITLFSCTKQASDQLAPNIDKIGFEKMQSYYKDIDKFSNASARRSNPNQFYFTCASSWGNEFDPGNTGLAVLADVVKFRVGNATMKSYWIAITANYTDAAGNHVKDWSQFGYAVDKGGLFPAFFRYRWINGRMYQAPPTIIYPEGSGVPLVVGTKVRFEIKNIEGTWWTFSRNGQEAFRADLEITQFDGKREACTESWGSGDFSPSVMTYYMDKYKDGVWSHVEHGISDQYSWGIAGQVQNPNYIQSQFAMGGNTPALTSNVTPWLWHPN